MNETVTNIDKLREIAIDQHGFVTTAQALEEGVTHASLSMLVKRGRLERCAHGVYRVPQVPATAFDNFMLAILWAGDPSAALSHETALDAYGVSDVNPTKIHLVVPKAKRIRKSLPSDYVVHKENVDPCDMSWWEQIPIVSLRKAIEQCIDAGLPDYLAEQAIDRARSRGLLLFGEADALKSRLVGRQWRSAT